MKPVIDHLHITVQDLVQAEAYCDRMLPLPGFDLSLKEATFVPEHDCRLIEYNHQLLSIGLVRCRATFAGDAVNRRSPGALHHPAFRAESPGEVVRFCQQIQALPSAIVHPPAFYPEYCPDDYAFFFKDAQGAELEIVSLERSRYFPEVCPRTLLPAALPPGRRVDILRPVLLATAHELW